MAKPNIFKSLPEPKSSLADRRPQTAFVDIRKHECLTLVKTERETR